MIIPIGTSDRYKPGDIVVLVEDHIEPYAIFCKGHEFVYVDYDDHGHNLRDGNIFIKKYHINSFTHKITIEQAKKEFKDREDYWYYKKYLKRNCPHKTDGYADRDSYDACKIKQKDRKTYDDTCTPCSACIRYVKLDKRSKQYVRKLKLEKIDET